MYEMLINEAYKIVEKDKIMKSAKRRNKSKQNTIKKVKGDMKRQDDSKIPPLPSNNDDHKHLNDKKDHHNNPETNRKKPEEIGLMGFSQEALKKLVGKFVGLAKNIRDICRNNSPLILLKNSSKDKIDNTLSALKKLNRRAQHLRRGSSPITSPLGGITPLTEESQKSFNMLMCSISFGRLITSRPASSMSIKEYSLITSPNLPWLLTLISALDDDEFEEIDGLF